MSKHPTNQDVKLTRLLHLFEDLFGIEERTVLVKGESDPLYLPASETGGHAEIHFAHGFFSSAMHEIAHWLIAGEKRRLMIDYGYWYKPDGRSEEEQKSFEAFESFNQGLEWILSVAAGHDFHVSVDNLSGSWNGGRGFAEQVRERALDLLDKGLSGRTKIMVDALVTTFSDRSSFDAYWQNVRTREILPPHQGFDLCFMRPLLTES